MRAKADAPSNRWRSTSVEIHMTKLGKVTQETKGQGQKILMPLEFVGSTLRMRT